MVMKNNTPKEWKKCWPKPLAAGHKYDHGHVMVVGGDVYVGAAVLAAYAGLRMGAGLSTILAPSKVWPVYASAVRSVMVRPIENHHDFCEAIQDDRVRALVIGPGAGKLESTMQYVEAALKKHKATILDADTLTVFEASPQRLFDQIHGEVILTPHEGEFARLFHALQGDRQERAMKAAQWSNAVIVLKGPHTVIAAPDGRCLVNHNAPKQLATAGSGDVLAGMIGGLLARGMPAFEAAAAAVWLHGDAAAYAGTGMISEDLLQLLPASLQRHKLH